ncbi:hypothetical protein GCM10012275_16840 [Longimycelium tulufanense]|uniref:DUF3040 domain-containing protein n=1 Tax=Longimycelium tulufanense TaxID=907463 RepID=A0A8J3C737_9PSEU|nr:DUF3040 domain-containing protein [Longimycelium tulufanense]GGM46429.1 hypothetical protein GCM10012275_16840 [Longimycelium tulufanense]
MLSRRERQQLARIELWFEQSDPELAEALATGRPTGAGRRRWPYLVLLYLGAVLSLAGVVAASPTSFFGGLVILTGTALAYLWRREKQQRRLP